MPKSLYIASSLMALISSPIAPQRALADSVPATSGKPQPVEFKPRPGMVVERSNDGLFYVEAQVNGAPVHFVVDSGASVVVLSAADAARADVGGGDGVDVETAAGASPMRRAQIKQVVLAGQKLTDVEAAIVNRNLKVSLLGQSALSQLASVTFKGNRLVFE